MEADLILAALSVGHVTNVPTRQEIRTHVARRVAEIKAKASAGANPVHVSLDQGDQLNAFIALLPQSSQDEFARVYTEEMEAALSVIKGEVEQKELAEIKQASANYTVVSTIAFIIAVVTIGVLLRAIN